jgi:AraC-like DNA-binding protein
MAPAPGAGSPIVGDERDWRRPQQGMTLGGKVIATRWHAVDPRPHEVSAETPDDRRVVKIALRAMNLRLTIAGRTVLDGIAAPGMFHVTEPTAPVRCLFRGSYDALHLHVPNRLLAECGQELVGRRSAGLCPTAVPGYDPMVDSLGRALLDADRMGSACGELYADSLSIAIAMRLLRPADGGGCGRQRASALVQWRLKRAVDYVEARLGEAVSLSEIASAVGLTRMHFAAQFRATTGLRPHEYLLRRRIERAQELLVGTHLPLVDIALSLGFQSQSHFTSVFKRFTGQPPNAWRQSRRDRMDDGAVPRLAANDRDPHDVGALGT